MADSSRARPRQYLGNHPPLSSLERETFHSWLMGAMGPLSSCPRTSSSRGPVDTFSECCNNPNAAPGSTPCLSWLGNPVCFSTALPLLSTASLDQSLNPTCWVSSGWVWASGLRTSHQGKELPLGRGWKRLRGKSWDRESPCYGALA